MTDIQATCKICGEPMPAGEEMFKFHGYSGPCPKPPLARHIPDAWDRIAADDELKLARQKLSMHEIRRIIKHAQDAAKERAVEDRLTTPAATLNAKA